MHSEARELLQHAADWSSISSVYGLPSSPVAILEHRALLPYKNNAQYVFLPPCSPYTDWQLSESVRSSKLPLTSFPEPETMLCYLAKRNENGRLK